MLREQHHCCWDSNYGAVVFMLPCCLCLCSFEISWSRYFVPPLSCYVNGSRTGTNDSTFYYFKEARMAKYLSRFDCARTIQCLWHLFIKTVLSEHSYESARCSHH